MKFLLALVFTLSSLAGVQANDPTTFEDLARQATANVDADPALAARLFQKALALQPSWAEGWLYLGGALYGLQHYPEALQAFDKGISLAPPMGSSFAFRGLCQFELKHYDRALEDFQKGEAMGLGANRQFESVVRQHAALLYIHSSLFDQAMAQLQPLSNYGDNSPGVIEAAGLCALTMSVWPDQLSAQKRALVNLAGKAAVGRRWPQSRRSRSRLPRITRDLSSRTRRPLLARPVSHGDRSGRRPRRIW